MGSEQNWLIKLRLDANFSSVLEEAKKTVSGLNALMGQLGQTPKGQAGAAIRTGFVDLAAREEAALRQKYQARFVPGKGGQPVLPRADALAYVAELKALRTNLAQVRRAILVELGELKALPKKPAARRRVLRDEGALFGAQVRAERLESEVLPKRGPGGRFVRDDVAHRRADRAAERAERLARAAAESSRRADRRALDRAGQDEAAKRGVTKTGSEPKSRGGIPGLRQVPGPDDIDAAVTGAKELLRDPKAIRRLERRVRRISARYREIGLIVGIASEDSEDEHEARAIRRGTPTNIQRRGQLSLRRERRIGREEVEFEERLRDEPDATVLRRRGRIRALQRANRAVSAAEERRLTDIPAAGTEAAAAKAHRDRISAEASARQNTPARAAAERARREASARAEAVRYKVDPRGDTEEQRADRSAAVALKKKTASHNIHTRTIAQTNADDIRAAAQHKAAQARENSAINAATRQILRDTALPGERGTLIQRAQARIAERGGGPPRLPTDFAKGGQLLASKAITTAGFALSGAALYGAVSGIKEVIRESEELEQVLALVKAQFNALGQANQFGDFRKAILSISRETGVTADEVAKVGLNLKGAFGGDNAKAVQAMAQTLQLVKLTGIEVTEALDSLTATTQTFGVTAADIGDVAIGLQGRTGVPAKEIISFTADLGASAKAAGLLHNEVAAIGAVASRFSGRGGSALAEAFSRILPKIRENSVDILGVFRDISEQNPALKKSFDTVASAVSTGKSGVILKQLVQNYDDLNASQQSYIKGLIAGDREMFAVEALFNNNDEAAKQFAATLNDGGTQARAWAEQQKTLKQQLSQFRQEVLQLGLALYEGGLRDAFGLIVTGGNALVKVLRTVIVAFGELNDLTDHNLVKFLALFAAVRVGARVFRAYATAAKAAAAAEAVEGATSAASGAGRIGRFLTAPAAIAGGIGGRYRAARSPVGAVGQLALPGLGAGQAAAGAGRLGSGLAAVGLTPQSLAISAAIATSLAAVEKVQSQRKQLDAAAADLAAKVRDVNDKRLEELRALAESKQNAFHTLAAALLGKDLPTDIIEREQGHRDPLYDQRVADLKLARDAKVGVSSPQKAPGFAPPVLKLLLGRKPKQSVDFDKLLKLYADQPKDPEVQALVDDAIARSKGSKQNRTKLAATAVKRAAQEKDQAAEAAKAALDPGGAVPENLTQTRDLYQAGERTLGQLLRTYQYTFENFAAASKAGPLPKDQADLLAKIRSDFAKDISGVLRDEVDQQNRIGALFGNDDAGADVKRLLAYLKDPRVTDRSERQKAAKDIVELRHQMLAERASEAASAKESLAILTQGEALDPDVRIELSAELLSVNVNWQNFLNSFLVGFVNTANLTREVARVGYQQALAAVRAAKAAFAAANPETRAQTSGQLNAIDKALAALPGANLPQLAPAKIYGTAKEKAGYAKTAAADAKKGNDAREEILKAQNDLDEALAARDPLVLARIAIRNADRLADLARQTGNAADRIRAAADKVKAEQGLAKAMEDIFAAQSQLAQTVAEIAGDTVGAARTGAELVAHQLAVATAAVRAAGGDPKNNAEVLGLQGQLKQANESVRSTDFARKLEDIDFARDMERITEQQQIAQLEALIALASPEETRNLLRKIKSLKDSASADLQFSIPSEIKLPTIYEVRRAQQTAANGTGYNDSRVVSTDNRAVNIGTLTISNGMDEAAARAMFSDALNDGTRVFGTQPRRY